MIPDNPLKDKNLDDFSIISRIAFKSSNCFSIFFEIIKSTLNGKVSMQNQKNKIIYHLFLKNFQIYLKLDFQKLILNIISFIFNSID